MNPLRYPLRVLGLIGLWLLLTSSVEPGEVLLGSLLALAITAVTAPTWPRRRWPPRPWLIVKYLWRMSADIITANFRIAVLVLRPRRPRPLFVELPVALEDPFALYVLANTISLTPGTVSADLSEDRRVLLVHILDTGPPGTDAEAAARDQCRDITERYECLLMEIFR